MANGINLETLRAIVEAVARHIGVMSTHDRLDGDLTRQGFPATTIDEDGGSKAVRAESSAAAVPDDQLLALARRVLRDYQGLTPAIRYELEDVVWASELHPKIPKRARHGIAAAVPREVLRAHYLRLRDLLNWLFVTDDDPYLNSIFGGESHRLSAQIHKRFYHQGAWTVAELFDAVGAIDASDRRFGLLLEGLVDGEFVPDEDAQRQLVAAINPPLEPFGVELRETGSAEGYPVFKLVSQRSAPGRPKNLIFASSAKPDLRMNAIDNTIELMSHTDEVLIYDRPITAEGIRWRDLQDWWKATQGIDDDALAKSTLYKRLARALPESSPPQRWLFQVYLEIHGDAVPDLPALLPEVWLHWDPKTIEARGVRALLQLRMDFLLLLPRGARIVLEVDGKTHYAVPDGEKKLRPDPATYARTVAGGRELTLAGYEVYRFGATELNTHERARATLLPFFTDLFRQHKISADAR